MKRYVVLLITIFLVGGCAVRELDFDALPNETSLVKSANTQTVFVSALRSEDQTGQIFGEGRTNSLHFAQIDVSIPPNQQQGRTEWQSSTPDPEREFALIQLQLLGDADTFGAKLRQSRTESVDETLLYIHGYNTRAVEAIFRLAQIQEDFGIKNPSVLFTWPSAGSAGGYVYDRDSVLFARDHLEQVLNDLTRNDQDVLIVAHSMGAHLLMETLRQSNHKGNAALFYRVSGVVLVSPDIDPDVFASQIEAIPTLPDPFLIFASNRDRALGYSSILTGKRPRVGSLLDASKLDRDEITLVDFSRFSNGRALDHLTPFTSPEAIEFLRKAVQPDRKIVLDLLRNRPNNSSQDAL